MVALALTQQYFKITYTADQHQDRAESTGNGFDLLMHCINFMFVCPLVPDHCKNVMYSDTF